MQRSQGVGLHLGDRYSLLPVEFAWFVYGEHQLTLEKKHMHADAVCVQQVLSLFA